MHIYTNIYKDIEKNMYIWLFIYRHTVRYLYVCMSAYILFICMHAMLLQSCPTLWDSMDCRLQESAFHGIFQARILEWVARLFCRRSSQTRNQTQVSLSLLHCRWIFTNSDTQEVNLINWIKWKSWININTNKWLNKWATE